MDGMYGDIGGWPAAVAAPFAAPVQVPGAPAIVHAGAPVPPPLVFDLTIEDLAPCTTLEHVVSLCLINEDEWNILHQRMGEPTDVRDIAGAENGEFLLMLQEDPPLSMRLKSRAKRLLRACRIKCNFNVAGINAPPPAATSKAPGVPPIHDRPDRKVKLSHIVDGANDTDLKPIDPSRLRDLFADYRNERGEFPHVDLEPTSDQIAAVYKLINADVPPYVDFSIFGPHGRRMQAKLQLIAHVHDPDGSWRRIDLPGPPNFDSWWRSWQVYQCTLILLRASKIEPLERDGEMIRSLSQNYGDSVWFLIYQADVRLRSEHMDRIRRRYMIDNPSL